jgi:ADP-heptose:LPS heptosyltransferase
MIKRFVAKILANILLVWYRRTKSNSEFESKSLKSILIIEATRMGDVLVMLPLIQTLAREIPYARIIIAIDEQYADIFQCLPKNIDVVRLPETKLIGGFIKAKAMLSKLKTDLAISASPAFKNALLTLTTKSKFKIGYFSSDSATTPFLHRSKISAMGFQLREESEYYRENISIRCLKIAEAMGIKNSIIDVSLVVPKPYSDQGSAILRRLKIGTSKYIVMHSFSGWHYRSWEIRNFIVIAQQFEKVGVHSIIVGTKIDEQNLNRQMENSDKIHWLFGESISVLIGLLKKASLFIGNDSGPLHLASAIGIPCIGLFGPASPEMTAPMSKSNIYLYEKVECSPCDQKKCIRPDNPCINLISADTVAQQALSILKIDAMEK